MARPSAIHASSMHAGRPGSPAYRGPTLSGQDRLGRPIEVGPYGIELGSAIDLSIDQRSQAHAAGHVVQWAPSVDVLLKKRMAVRPQTRCPAWTPGHLGPSGRSDSPSLPMRGAALCGPTMHAYATGHTRVQPWGLGLRFGYLHIASSSTGTRPLAPPRALPRPLPSPPLTPPY